MTGFEDGDIVFDHAAEPHDFDGMRAQALLMVIAQGDEEKQPGQEGDHDNADGGSRQELEVKMLWTKKPGNASSEKSATYLGG